MARNSANPLFPEFSNWPFDTKKGIAFGWNGWAWVWFQLLDAGLVKVSDESVFDDMAEMLVSDINHYDNDSVSHAIGFGSLPLIGLMLTRYHPRFRRALRESLNHWYLLSEITVKRELIDGPAGAILTCAEMEARSPGVIPVKLMRILWKKTVEAVGHELKSQSSLDTGFYHGLAGYLYALETGKAVFDLKVKAELIQRCNERLWNAGFPSKDGILWPKKEGELKVGIHGWCQGAPGVALSYLGCHQLSGGSHYLEKFDEAIRSAKAVNSSMSILCCGDSGRAQILIESSRLLQDQSFLRAGRKIGRACLASNVNHGKAKDSLFYGKPGDLYLELRMKYPDQLPMPGFGAFSFNRF